jgi:hypothetical protein
MNRRQDVPMPLNPQVCLPSAAVLILLLGCGGEAPPSRPAPPQPSPAVGLATPAPAAAVTDPFGYYLLEEAGALPGWARSIDHLHLSNVDLQGEEMVTVPLWGHLRMKEEAGGRDFRLDPVRLEGQALSFATQEIDGISYAFEGEFLVSGELPAQAPQGVVLRGRLRRLDRGQPAGEMDARFTYTPGD